MRQKSLHFYDPLYEVLLFGDIYGARGLRSIFRSGSGQISLKKSILPLIRCPEVARLQWLNQAGFIPLIFPSGTHNRFAHALGTLHLGSIALNSVTINFKETNESKTLFQVLDVKKWVEEFVAALFLHDLGHYPFSHALENNFGLQSVLKKDFVSHEKVACQLIAGNGPIFDAYRKRYKRYSGDMVSDVLNTNPDYQAGIICFLISGDYEHIRNMSIDDQERSVLKIMHELVSGQYDLDRIDHYRRDSFFTGLGHTFKPSILLHGLSYTCKDGHVEVDEHPNKDAVGQISTLLFVRNQLHEYCFGELRNISFGAMLNSALVLHLDSIKNDDRRKSEALAILAMTDGELLYHLFESKSRICKERVSDIMAGRPYPCVATFSKQPGVSSKEIVEKFRKIDPTTVLGFSKYFDKSYRPWLTEKDVPDSGRGYVFSLEERYEDISKKLHKAAIKGISEPDEQAINTFGYLTDREDRGKGK